MVRGPAAVLAAYAAALIYFAVAGSLPELGSADATLIVSGSVALVALAACTYSLLDARDEAPVLALLVLGGGLLAGAFTVGGADAASTVAKALFAAAAGMLLARWLDAPAILVAVALFAAGIDIASVLGGPSSVLIHEHPRITDFLTFSLPVWGGGSGELGLSDVVFLSFFAAGAWRHGLRRPATAAGMLLGLIAVLVAGVVADEALPAIPGLALGLLLPNLDRLGPLLRSESGG